MAISSVTRANQISLPREWLWFPCEKQPNAAELFRWAGQAKSQRGGSLWVTVVGR